MGKGDKKSKRGKIYRGTFGKHRLRKKQKTWVAVPKEKEKEKEKVKEAEAVEDVKAQTKKAVKKKPGRKKAVKKESD
jgi:30S ribosomal protein S31